MKKTLCYYALYDHNILKGVHNKIKATIRGLNLKGINSEVFGFENNGAPSFFKMMISISFSSYNFYIIRSVSYYNIFLIIPILVARFRGVCVIIDVPTPFKSALSEIRNIEKNYFLLWIKLSGTIIGGLFIYLVSNIILNYGDDYIFLDIFKKKNLMTSNFFDEDVYNVRSDFPSNIDKRLNLIGVGNFSNSQGYDIVLDAIKVWNNDMNEDYKVFLKLIGSGDFDNELKFKFKELKIEKFVEFTGFKNFDEYSHYYNDSHIAIGSIASFRKKLYFHSPLKEREYTFVGIPFISSIRDIGFDTDCSFRFVIDSFRPVESVIDVFKAGREISNISPQKINDYAKLNLTFENFFNRLSEKLKENEINLYH